MSVWLPAISRAQIHLLRRLLAAHPNEAQLHTQHWKVTTWLGHPQQALDELSWLMVHHLATTDMLEQGAGHAQQLFMFPQQIAIYRELAKRKALSPQQLTSWMQAYEYQGHSVEELRDITLYENTGCPQPESILAGEGAIPRREPAAATKILAALSGGKPSRSYGGLPGRFGFIRNLSRPSRSINTSPKRRVSYWNTRIGLANLVGDTQDETYDYQQLDHVTTVNGDCSGPLYDP
ncbi:hypothetical protein P4S72_18310 [Vibrio sp. PP-XX7]